MADDDIREKIVTEFFLNTCKLRRQVNDYDFLAWRNAASVKSATYKKELDDVTPLTTGSVAEFYIEPMLSCVGDVDVMFHASSQLAIPAGYSPPRELPAEFDSRVNVYEIVDSGFPGYVYLMVSYLLTECVDGKYNAAQCQRELQLGLFRDSVSMHGPALAREWPSLSVALAPTAYTGCRITKSPRSTDIVFCVRCLIWPSQATHWPTRHRYYSWPDSATVDRVVSNGCDVVRVAHHLCRQDKRIGLHQWRLSFSRAEITLLNSWMPLQQIVYHLLRRFMKTKKHITDNVDNSGADTLSNYNIKTLMLWACELKSRSWWIDNLNIVKICVELLHTLAIWLTDACCQHYFINNCNLFDRYENSRYAEVTVNRLMSVTRASFSEWCIDSYIHKCAELCLGRVSSFPWDSQSGTPRDELHRIISLQKEVSAIVKSTLHNSRVMNCCNFFMAQAYITKLVSRHSLTVRSCLWWIDQLAKSDQALSLYFTAVAFLHVAYKIAQSSLTDVMLDVLTTTCLESNDARRCLNARHSSVLSLSQAAKLMKIVANNSHSTVQLIEIELAKAYLHRTLRNIDSDSYSIYCVSNVYLAVLYYIAGQYQMAIEHCALVTSLQDHSHWQCSSHVVQGNILPRIDDQVDNILGLAVLYEYIRAATLNEEQERRNVSVFTTELFVHYLHIKFLSVTNCHRLPQTSSTDEIHRYRNCFCSSTEIFITDVIALRFIMREKCPPNDRLVMADRGETKSLTNRQLETSKLVELLQQSAVEHLTTSRELIADSDLFTKTDFKALYAYRCGLYQHCLQMSICGVRALISNQRRMLGLPILLYPMFIQLLDDDIVSLIGLKVLVNPSHKWNESLGRLTQLSLSLYLVTQCQIKLQHSLASLATTFEYVQLARLNIENYYTNDQLFMLKFVEQKILRYQQTTSINTDQDDSRQRV